MNYQFQTIVAGEKNPPARPSFMEAWQDMYTWVKKQLDAGQMSYQVLETAIWIEQQGEVKSPILFYDARDLAIRKYNWTQPK
jgi:hypothetical protein